MNNKLGSYRFVKLFQKTLLAVLVLMVLVGALAAAQPAQAADSCIYSDDMLTALCPSGANSTSYLYQWYGGQWNHVATAWVSGGFTYLTSGGMTIAQNNTYGQLWVYVPATYNWINITGMSSQAVNNALVENQLSYNQVRHIQTMAGLTSMPNLWP